MRIGRTISSVESGSIPEYIMRVHHHTSELLFLLEAAECIKTHVERGKRDTTNGFAPSTLSITLKSTVLNTRTTTETEFGHSGRLAQLAYIGWVAAIDGVWEQYRTNPPFDKKESDLRYGQQADLFGDLHKIRNDLVKHRGIAQARNTGRCTVLKWFRTGQHMVMSLEHVLTFLHQLGSYLGSFLSKDGRLIIEWHVRNDPLQNNAVPYRVISNRVSIWDIPPEKGSGFGLFYSMMFADGIAWTVLVRQASVADRLADEMKALRCSPLDEHGAIIHPDIGPLDVPATYRIAKQMLLSGEFPADPGTPWIQFR